MSTGLDIVAPMSLSRTSMALQFCIEELIHRATGPVRFYTITIPHLMPWKEVGMRHRDLLNRLNTAQKRRTMPRYGGVRVFEEGEKTHRPHVHWVITPTLPRDELAYHAEAAGFGHIWLDPRHASAYIGMYLSKYLSKGRRMHGVRRWNCFGEFSSVKVRDVEITSPDIESFRASYAAAKEQGLTGTQAYTEAARRSNLLKFSQFIDPLQGQGQPTPPEAEIGRITTILKTENGDQITHENVSH